MILDRLRAGCDEAEGQGWTVAVDATVVRAHQHAAGARRPPPADVDPARLAPAELSAPVRARGAANDKNREALGRSRGGLTSKIHLLADLRCRPVARLTSAGQRHDSLALVPLMDSVASPGRARDGRGPGPGGSWAIRRTPRRDPRSPALPRVGAAVEVDGDGVAGVCDDSGGGQESSLQGVGGGVVVAGEAAAEGGADGAGEDGEGDVEVDVEGHGPGEGVECGRTGWIRRGVVRCSSGGRTAR